MSNPRVSTLSADSPCGLGGADDCRSDLVGTVHEFEVRTGDFLDRPAVGPCGVRPESIVVAEQDVRGRRGRPVVRNIATLVPERQRQTRYVARHYSSAFVVRDEPRHAVVAPPLVPPGQVA